MGAGDEAGKVGLEDLLRAGGNDEEPGRIGADGDERDRSEGEDAGVADEDVEPDDEGQVNETGHDDGLEGRAAAERGDLRDDDDERGEQRQRPDRPHSGAEELSRAHHTRVTVERATIKPCGRTSSMTMTAANANASR